MKRKVISAAFCASLLLSASAFADETVVREHTESSGPGVTVGVPGVGVTVGERDRTTVTTEERRPSDCASKTVRREDMTGSTTVHKERCD